MFWEGGFLKGLVFLFSRPLWKSIFTFFFSKYLPLQGNQLPPNLVQIPLAPNLAAQSLAVRLT